MKLKHAVLLPSLLLLSIIWISLSLVLYSYTSSSIEEAFIKSLKIQSQNIRGAIIQDVVTGNYLRVRSQYAIKNGKVVGYLIDEIYYEKRLLLEYYLIGFVWIERALLNNNERSFISNNFFNYLSIKEAPFGAIINYTNHISRKYFERNGFVPNWIRASLRKCNSTVFWY